MPLRGPDDKEYDGAVDEWIDAEAEKVTELAKKVKKEVEDRLSPVTQELVQQPQPESPSGEQPIQQLENFLSSEDIFITGEKDEQTGLLPVILKKAADIAASVPAGRGRHVGSGALNTLSRMPLVGLKFLRESAEFVVYDDQPPPSGEYAVQALGITTLEYDGIQQNHLLVSFKAGQLTGFGMESNYIAQTLDIPGVVADQEVDITTLLGGRDGRTIVINYNRTMSVKVNKTTADPTILYSSQSPYIVDLGLNLQKLYITTTKATKVRLQAW